MSERDDWNARIIEEFRESGGSVGGPFEGAPLLLLHTTGAKSGRERVNPVMYQVTGEAVAVFASKGGADTNPDWYHNLRAHSRATVELGNDTFDVEARVAEGEERQRIWERQKREWPAFGDYEHKTPRHIPVVILERAG